MSDIAIRVENLGKMYHIGGPQERYRTFRDAMTRTVAAPFRRARDLLRGQAYGAAELKEQIWALKDVTFEVKHGEVVGVIGRNGAGKSTLLKVLSRITEPTTGSAALYGRVGALLEVGTGFHPELTGRENVYLNSAILGMKRQEIDRRFDEIVAFAEIERFIDTPVKHYSSGMGLRLGFAVAAHLEPEILIVDEVLAVGDAQFQKKCLGKMSDVASTGRTVLFVSHNMGAVQSLCTRGILLNNGTIEIDDVTNLVIQQYLSAINQVEDNAFTNSHDRKGTGDVRFIAGQVLNEHNEPSVVLTAGLPARFRFVYENVMRVRKASIRCTVYNQLGVGVAHFSTDLVETEAQELAQRGEFTCVVPVLPFPPGSYHIAVAIGQMNTVFDHIPNALCFTIENSVFFKTGKSPRIEYGTTLVRHEWCHAEGVQ